MRKTHRLPYAIGLVAVLMAAFPNWTGATPTTEIWTPAVADIQPYKVWHLTYDTYFSVAKKLKDGGHAFPIDVGLTVGILPYKNANLEVGVDLFEPTDYPLQFNAKFGIPEGGAGKGAPGMAVGIFGVGTKGGVTNYNIVYGVITKTMGQLGRVHLGYYRGNKKLLVDPAGKADEHGLMVAFDRVLVKDKLTLGGDWQQGKNSFGAGGAGLSYNFASNVGVIFGYTFYNSEAINGKPMMTVQLDVNFK